jgi:hypothetical protein
MVTDTISRQHCRACSVRDRNIQEAGLNLSVRTGRASRIPLAIGILALNLGGDAPHGQ